MYGGGCDGLGACRVLGAVEGETEVLPVSSTDHLILLVDLLGFRAPPGRVFEVAIQLGTILAIRWAYQTRLFGVAAGLGRDSVARRFATAVVLAFLPAAAIGALTHSTIKTVLFFPWVVVIALIAGWLAILAVERTEPQFQVHEAEAIGPGRALAIGAFQVLAMVPGVSRSGATILGAMLLRVDRLVAAELSFFLAIPTMFGAMAFDLYKNRAALDAESGALVAIGFAAAFVTALLVVRRLVAFVGRHGFAPFAWYRIVLGAAMLVVLIWTGTA
ncbi:undecaprenyl-diphosphate phosphatase [Roseomonas sp. KE2513]|nr:undecaprenyl-diphosphate phosphatase [Roseomonas sp. KE2513]